MSIAWDYRDYLRALEKKDEMEEAFRWDPTQLEIKDTIKTKCQARRSKDWVAFAVARKRVKELKKRLFWQRAKNDASSSGHYAEIAQDSLSSQP